MSLKASLKARKRLLLLSLIIKGALVYATGLVTILLIVFADSFSADTIILYALPVGAMMWILSRLMSANDFKRIFFLSREERRYFDEETV